MFKYPSTLAVLSAAVFLAAALRPAHAQVLADKVPPDALLYAGWAGSDSLGTAYDASRLKAFLDALNLPAFLGNRFAQAMALETDPQKLAQAKFAQELFAAIAKSPTALYVGPLDFSVNPAQPVPRIALFSKVGPANAAAMATRLNTAIMLNRQPGQPDAAALAAGDFLLLYIGDANIHARLEGLEPPTIHALADSEAFTSAFKHLGADAGKSAASLYIDGQATVEMIASAVQAGPNVQARTLYPPLADGLGLNSLRQFAWAGNFDGTDWQASTFLGMRDRRPGLLAFFDHGPLSQESLKLIPQSATCAGAFRFDGMRLLDDVTTTAAKLNDQYPKQIETALTTVYVWSGIDLKRELLPAFGDEFVYYGSPEGAGNSFRGFTLVNRLRDAKKADSAVSAIENFANLLIQQRNPNSKLQFQTQTLPAPWDKVTAHVLPLENFAPAWAITQDTFFFSMSLSGLQSAMEMTAGNKPTLLDNPQFQAMRKKFGHNDFAAFSFSDLQKSAPETYEFVNHILTAALARTADPQPYVLPPLNKILPTLGPAMKVSWTDDQGYHAQESSPFPMAGYLSPSTYIPLVLAQQIQARRQQEQEAKTLTAPAGGLP